MRRSRQDRGLTSRRHRLVRRGLLYSLGLGFLILGLGGVGFWLIDPRVHSLHDGLWLAFTTAATVGYGDVVPSNTASRIFSVFVVLLAPLVAFFVVLVLTMLALTLPASR